MFILIIFRSLFTSPKPILSNNKFSPVGRYNYKSQHRFQFLFLNLSFTFLFSPFSNMQPDEVGRRSPRPAREPSHPDPPQVTLVRSFGDNDHHDLIDWSDHSDDQFPRGLKSDSLVSGVTVSGVCEEFTRKIQVKDRFLCSFLNNYFYYLTRKIQVKFTFQERFLSKH